MIRSGLVLPVLVTAATASMGAQTPVPTPAEQIAAAVLPLPEVMRAGAGVRGYTASLALVTLREGTNTMVCTADRPGDDEFDVRCYDRQFLQAIDRRRELAEEGLAAAAVDRRFEEEVAQGRLRLPDHPTAGYRMLGPITAYDPRTATFTAAIEKWQSVHFPYRTAEELGLPTTRRGHPALRHGVGHLVSHVMIEHTPPK